MRAVRRLLIVVAAVLLWAAPAQAFSKQTGTRTMSDGVKIAYDLYEPDGTAPAGGWPGVVVMHGLGGSKDDMATIAQTFASHDYAALAYTDCAAALGRSKLADVAGLEAYCEAAEAVNDAPRASKIV